MDFYGFYTGKIFDAYKYLGAHVEEKGVTFRTWIMEFPAFRFFRSVVLQQKR